MTAWIVAALCGLVCVVLTFRLLADRARRKQQGLFGPWPIKRIRLHELDPVFTPGPFGPTIATEVSFIGRGPMIVPGGTSDAERGFWPCWRSGPRACSNSAPVPVRPPICGAGMRQVTLHHLYHHFSAITAT